MPKINRKPITKKNIIKILLKIKIKKLYSQKIKINQSLNRIISEKVISKINLPPFNNSAVDGYALHNNYSPYYKKLSIIDKITAGENKKKIIKKNEAVRIFTGAKMPSNSKTVVMQENTISNNKSLQILKKPDIGENCRFAGEDIEKGKIILNSGDKISSKNISLLAAIGKKEIKVKEKLRIGFFTSGNELNDPSEKLKESKINNSNKFALHSLLKQDFFDSKFLGILKDSRKHIIKSFMKNINKFSVIITTGGASVGDEDHLVKILQDYGSIFFWKTAIKPGRPLAIGKISKTIFICLPGNPVSVYLLFGMIVKPFLEFLCGSKLKTPDSYEAKVNFKMKKKTERLEWIRVNVIRDNKKDLWVEKYPKQGSGMISSIAYSDGIIEIPEDVKEIKIGDKFDFYSFDNLFK